MTKGSRDDLGTADRDIFNIPGQSMSDDVSDAARILRGFVSHLTPATSGSQEDLYDTSMVPEPSAYENDPFHIPGTDARGPNDSHLDALMEQADHISNSLTDGVEFLPRVVEGASGVFSLHPKEDVPVAQKHPSIRLRYKGKASKKQLERLRRRIQQHTQPS